MAEKKVEKALVLAGGKGTRMRPFTYEIPKPLIPVQGKPLLEYVIDLLEKYEIKEVILSIGYLGHKIREHFGDGSEFGVKIHYIEERKEMGTAGPIRLMEDSLKETFIMVNGDVLSDINLQKFMDFHFQHEGLATIALTEVEDVSHFGVAEMEGEKILKFIEKPQKSEAPSNWINAGLYVLEPKVINYVPKGKAMMETDVFPKLAKEEKLFGYKFKGQWFDTGTHEAYEKAIKEWKGI